MEWTRHVLGRRAAYAVFLAAACSQPAAEDLERAERSLTVALVAAGSTWRYLDNGSNQGTAWRASGFNDSAWKSGAAQLGYGDGDEATVVGFGPSSSSKHITSYFRKSFTVTDPAAYSSVNLRVLRDDGAIVYLNGTEVFRTNMPAGTVGHTTAASSAVGGADETTTFYSKALSPSQLAVGTNVLAVEIHQSGGTSSDLSFDLELTAGDSGAAVTRGPYLQMGTPTSAVVRWRTDVATNSRVRHGGSATTLDINTDDAAVTTEHEVRLTGLAANTTYFYAVGSTTSTLAGADAATFFITPPAAGSSRPTRVWALGDSGTANATAASVRNAYATMTGSRYTDVWLMLGDNAYNNGTDAEYQAAVFNMYPTFLRQSFLWPTIGNHDTAQSSSPPANFPYANMFTLPATAQAGGIASGSEKYYSFDFGNIHFVCLDSMSSSRLSGSAMLTWLANDLGANTKAWLIAYWHHPPYSKGSHDSDTSTELRDMRQNALPILEAHGIDLVLGGHSHNYERSYLIDGHYGASSTFTSAMKKDGGSGRPSGTGAYRKATLGPGVREGAVYVVAGSSGKVTTGTPLNHPAMFVSLARLGSMVLDINGGQLDARFLRETGAVDDSFSIIKGQGATNQPPTVSLTSPVAGASYVEPATITLSATASDGDGSVSKVEFFQGTALLATDTTAPYDHSWTGVAAGSYSVTAKATDDKGLAAASATVTVTVTSVAPPPSPSPPPPPPPPATLVAAASVWKYLDNGSNQGTAWRDVAFNDGGWASGPAQLGYGDGDEATVVSFGPSSSSKYITTYFRRSFTVADKAAYPQLKLSVKRDDGFVVYLNGTEVFRNNLPAGAITHTTAALTALGGADETAFVSTTFANTALSNGTNVLAVEIHQANGTSSDLTFDLELIKAP